MFKINDTFESTCIFTGGSHEYKVISRTETVLHCERIYYEIDGTHKGIENFEIHKDENGKEYIVLWTYRGEEGRHYAEQEEIVTDMEIKRKCKDCALFFKDPHNLCYLAETEQVDWETEACEEGFIQYYNRDDDECDYSPSNPWDAPGMSIKDFI